MTADLLIKTIRIENFRSFDVDAVDLVGLGKVNLIIGPNNVGKSNIFRLLKRFEDALDVAAGHAHNYKKEDIKRNKINFSFLNVAIYDIEHKMLFSNLDFFNPDNPIKLQIGFENGIQFDFEYPVKLRKVHSHDYSNVLTVRVNQSSWNYIKVDKTVKKLRYLLKFVDDERKYNLEDQKYNRFQSEFHGIRSKIKHLLVDSQLNDQAKEILDSIEKLDTQVQNKEFLSGINLVQIIQDAGYPAEESKPLNKESMEKYLGFLTNALIEILGDKEIKVTMDETITSYAEINPAKHFIIQSKKNKELINCQIADVGSGLIQLILILSVAYNHTLYKEGFKIFIEEPEKNLHPEALVRLINYINNIKKHVEESELNGPNLQLFINTHSTWLIDQAFVDQISSISRNSETGISIIQNIRENRDELRSLLDALGARPSQLLQSNLVFWVEGPSDRMYLKHWIESVNPDLKENTHFSFFLYGGALLSHYADDHDELERIPLLNTCRNAVIVCDRDKLQGEKLKDRVEYWKSLLETNPEKQNNILLLITNKKEIENYFSTHELRQAVEEMITVVREDIPIPKEDNETQRKEIKIELTEQLPDFEGSFAEHFSKLFVYNLEPKFEEKIMTYLEEEERIKHRHPLNSNHQTRIKDRLNGEKVELAKILLKNNGGKIPDDIKEDIKSIVEFIKKANGHEHDFTIDSSDIKLLK